MENPFRVEKTLEQQIVFEGVHIGYAQGPGDDGASPGAPAGTDGNRVRPGPLHELHDNEEVAGEIHLPDDGKFLPQPFPVANFPGAARLAADRPAQALFQSPAGKPGQKFIETRGFSPGQAEFRQALHEFQIKIAAPGDIRRGGNGLGNILEQFSHLPRAAQKLPRREIPGAAGIVEGPALGDADSGLVGVEIVLPQKTDVIGGHHRAAAFPGKPESGFDVVFFIGFAKALQLNMKTVRKEFAPGIEQIPGEFALAGEQRRGDIGIKRSGQRDQTVAVAPQFALVDSDFGARIAFDVDIGDEPDEILIATLVAGEQHQLAGLAAGCVGHPQVAAAKGFDSRLARSLIKLDQRKQIRQVGHRHRRHALLAQARKQRPDGDQPVADGKFGVQAKMDKSLDGFRFGHGSLCLAAKPSLHHAGTAVARSLQFRHGAEAAAVNGGGAHSGEDSQVLGGGVSLVPGETVGRIFPVEDRHFPIPGDLGDDRCGGDAADAGVAAGDCLGGVWPIGEDVAVDEDERGLDPESFNRAPHGEQAGLEDIEPVDFRWTGPAGGEADAMFDDFRATGFTPGGSELLGIVQVADSGTRIEHYRGGNHIPRKRAATDFVDASLGRRIAGDIFPPASIPHQLPRNPVAASRQIMRWPAPPVFP